MRAINDSLTVSSICRSRRPRRFGSALIAVVTAVAVCAPVTGQNVPPVSDAARFTPAVPTSSGSNLTYLPALAGGTGTPRVVSDAEKKAYQHLEEVMDRCHTTFWVYIDLADACNHFFHRAKMPDKDAAVTVNDGYTGTVHSGATSIVNTFAATQTWGGWYFMVGMLEGEEKIPKDNWGTYPNAGYDLTGATKLTFWARGEKGGEKVEFFAFNVGRDDQGNKLSTADYPDSSPKVTTCGKIAPPFTPCFVELTTTWQIYTITLAGLNLDLSYVLGGFGWVATANENNGQSVTFYLDDIQYDKPRLDEPRLLTSFETVRSNDDFDTVLKNVSFVYDDALALLAFLNNKDWRRAKLIADAFLYAQKTDRYWKDGRLRNAYQGGDLAVPPGWKPLGVLGSARPPGWWVVPNQIWLEDRRFVGSDTGNMAWVMLALLAYYQDRGGQDYLQAAVKLGEWIHQHAFDTRGAGGYTGGYAGFEPAPDKMTWKSTEHNLDLTVAFELLCRYTGDLKWHERSLHARNFVKAMWNDAEGYFSTGTGLEGTAVNTQAIPLDGQTWALMVLGRNPWTARAIAFVETHHYVAWPYKDGIIYEGFDFNENRDGPWFEGTGQMVIAYDRLSEPTKAQHFLNELREVQTTAPRNNGKGIVSAPFDSVDVGFDWRYYNRLHVGATAWFIFAEQGYSPYWHHTHPILVAPYAVRVTAPVTGTVGVTYPFTGSVVALSPVSPVTYSWQATEQIDVVHVGGASHSLSFTWSTTGTKHITLTAQSALGVETYTHMIDIQQPPPIYRLHGLNLGPFVKDDEDPTRGAQVSDERLQTLMSQIAPYTEWIRTYGCGGGLEQAGRIAHSVNLKNAMGAWLGRDTTVNDKEIACLIAAAKRGEVDLAVVGSEALFRNDLTPAQLVSYIQRVKSAAPGLTVTTSDVYARFVDNPSIVQAVDVVMVNLYPYWEGIRLDGAVALLHGRYLHVKAVAAGKEVMIGETGWPSCGDPVGQAIASPDNAASYFLNVVSWARANNVKHFIFSAFDEPWKAKYEGPQGACWGRWDKHGEMKPGSQKVFNGETIADNWSGAAIPGGPGNPTIEFTRVPAQGTNDDLSGQVWHVAPGDHRVAVYIRVNGRWWIKPYDTQPQTLILPDGSWTCDITTGGVDPLADKIVAYLIPITYAPPILLGSATLLAELDANVLAKVEAIRSAQATHIAQASGFARARQARRAIQAGYR